MVGWGSDQPWWWLVLCPEVWLAVMIDWLSRCVVSYDGIWWYCGLCLGCLVVGGIGRLTMLWMGGWWAHSTLTSGTMPQTHPCQLCSMNEWGRSLQCEVVMGEAAYYKPAPVIRGFRSDGESHFIHPGWVSRDATPSLISHHTGLSLSLFHLNWSKTLFLFGTPNRKLFLGHVGYISCQTIQKTSCKSTKYIQPFSSGVVKTHQ